MVGLQTNIMLRNILKRNPVRTDKINANRQSKMLKLNKIISERNLYLQEHSRAKLPAALKYCNEKLQRMNLQSWNQWETDEKCKTSQLELRPVYVRKKDRTRGHVFVVMLSYLLIQKLREYWNALDMTVEEGIDLLETLCTVDVQLDGNIPALYVSKPRKELEQFLTLANIPTPEIIPSKIKSKPN
ncbi:MAG: hypothetical protein LBJ00_06160 [Planctomycetaceae bacterium]|nr:hypothetical protein [Planctomycetaceae bacterium]